MKRPWIRHIAPRKLLLLGLLGCMLSLPTYAQHPALKATEEKLRQLGFAIYNEQEEAQRLQANFDFVRELVTGLQQPYSFDFDFDSLNMISIQDSPDQKFRIFSWHVPLSDGSYLYYGAIQLNTSDGQLRLIPLLDKTFEFENPAAEITTGDEWYGAQYEDIIVLDSQYLLLGWKGHTPEISQKVIEVLRFEDQSAILGNQIFQSPETVTQARVIYRFSSQLSMYMAHDPRANRIVVDHLVPSDPRHEGNYAFYGPDLSFDAWQIEGNRLRKIEHIQVNEQ